MTQQPTGTRGEPDAWERARPVRRAGRGNAPTRKGGSAPRSDPYTLAWLQRCRAILIRYDKKPTNYKGLIQLACALLWYRRLHAIDDNDEVSR